MERAGLPTCVHSAHLYNKCYTRGHWWCLVLQSKSEAKIHGRNLAQTPVPTGSNLTHSLCIFWPKFWSIWRFESKMSPSFCFESDLRRPTSNSSCEVIPGAMGSDPAWAGKTWKDLGAKLFYLQCVSRRGLWIKIETRSQMLWVVLTVTALQNMNSDYPESCHSLGTSGHRLSSASRCLAYGKAPGRQAFVLPFTSTGQSWREN